MLTRYHSCAKSVSEGTHFTSLGMILRWTRNYWNPALPIPETLSRNGLGATACLNMTAQEARHIATTAISSTTTTTTGCCSLLLLLVLQLLLVFLLLLRLGY